MSGLNKSNSKGASGKSTSDGNKKPGVFFHRNLGVVLGISDNYIRKFLIEPLALEAKARQLELDRKKTISQEQEQELDVVRFAFTLLRDEYGSMELAKINPYVVLSCARAALTDRLPAFPTNKDEAALVRFRNKLHDLHIKDVQAEQVNVPVPTPAAPQFRSQQLPRPITSNPANVQKPQQPQQSVVTNAPTKPQQEPERSKKKISFAPPRPPGSTKS